MIAPGLLTSFAISSTHNSQQILHLLDFGQFICTSSAKDVALKQREFLLLARAQARRRRRLPVRKRLRRLLVIVVGVVEVRGLLDRSGIEMEPGAYLLRSKRTTRSRVTTLKPGSRGEERQSQGLLLRSGGADRA